MFFTFPDLLALVEEAHARGKRVHVHAHAQPGLRNAIRAGCDVILHGAHIDDEALDGIGENGLWYMPTLYITSEAARKDSHAWPAHIRQRMERAHPIHREGVAKAYAMGLKIITGTDGISPDAMMTEVNELVNCGITPLDALTMATGRTAEALGIQDEVGTLAPGKRADILCVAGNPLKDIGILTSADSIAFVIKNGQVVASTVKPPPLRVLRKK